jgi:signal transduction histidine kinase
VLANLLTNAVKFVAPDVQPQIRIRATDGPVLRSAAPGAASAGSVRVWIEDNGIGIAPEYWEKVFGVFERLHTASTYPGTGIGLAIVRKAITRMGGHVGVESEVGAGSRFWIELQRADT